MYRHYAELAALKARLEQFSSELEAHVRAFVERDRVPNLRDAPAVPDRRYAQSIRAEDAKR